MKSVKKFNLFVIKQQFRVCMKMEKQLNYIQYPSQQQVKEDHSSSFNLSYPSPPLNFQNFHSRNNVQNEDMQVTNVNQKDQIVQRVVNENAENDHFKYLALLNSLSEQKQNFVKLCFEKRDSIATKQKQRAKAQKQRAKAQKQREQIYKQRVQEQKQLLQAKLQYFEKIKSFTIQNNVKNVNALYKILNIGHNQPSELEQKQMKTKNHLTYQKRLEVKAQIEKGSSYSEIARSFKICQSTIKKIKKQNPIKRRQKNKNKGRKIKNNDAPAQKIEENKLMEEEVNENNVEE